MKKLKLSVIMLVLILTFLSLNTLAFQLEIEEYKQLMENRESYLDWDRETLIIKGQSAGNDKFVVGQKELMAQRGAEVVAYRNTLLYLEGFNISSQTNVANLMDTSNRTSVNARGYLKNTLVVYKDYDYQSNIATAIVELPFSADSNFFRRLKNEAQNKQVDNINLDKDYEKNFEKELEDKDLKTSNKNYDSVIIDTRGLDVEIALFPQIFNSKGVSIYDINKVNQKNPKQRASLVAYSRDIKSAKNLKRVTENHLVLSAIDVVDTPEHKNTDVILNSEDSEKFQSVFEEIKDNRNVVFLID